MAEEGVAFGFNAAAAATKYEPSAVRRIFQKMRDILRAIANAFRGRGFGSPEKIFRCVESGEVGSRPRWRERCARPAASFLRSAMRRIQHSSTGALWYYTRAMSKAATPKPSHESSLRLSSAPGARRRDRRMGRELGHVAFRRHPMPCPMFSQAGARGVARASLVRSLPLLWSPILR
jgi:hypothetical protein